MDNAPRLRLHELQWFLTPLNDANKLFDILINYWLTGRNNFFLPVYYLK